VERATVLADDRKASDEPFLQRWSRRKSEAASAVADPAAPDIETASLDNARPAPVRPGDDGEGPTVDLAALPDIDSLDGTSDFSVFMQDGVPEALRTRALNRLWRLDPAFGHIDGLLEYGDDYTAAGVAAGAVKTIYKVGKGMISDDEEKADVAADAAAAGDVAAPGPPVERETAADMPAADDTDIPDKSG
jgi:Protein of unknown function (DUF3306)